MSDRIFPNLPELDSQHDSVPPPKTAGEWHRASWNALGHVASSLDLKSQPGSHVIHKLPDIWARLTMVHLALSLGKRHPLYDSVRGAFRGIIAVVALWKRRQWPFRVEAVELATYQQSPRAGRLFSVDATARDAAQGLSLSPATKWAKPFVLLLDESPIGLTSPLTLVCPVFGFEASRGAGVIPWWANGALGDPIEHLNAEQRGWVVRWIESTRAGLTGLENVNTGISTLILAELELFAEKLGGQASPGQLVHAISGIGNGACDLIGYTAPPANYDESTLELALKADRSDKTLIVLEQSTPAQWRKRSRDISVLPGLTFDAVEKLWKGLSDGIGGLSVPLPTGTEYEIADRLFLPRLVLVRVEKGEQAFPGASRVNGSDAVRHQWEAEPLLPIAPRLLKYLNPQTIAGAAEYRPTGDRLRVEVKLSLRGGAVTIGREYSSAELKLVDAIPILEVWPPFATPRWKTYFTFWGNPTTERAFAARPLYTSGADAEPDVTERRSNDEVLRQVFQSDRPPLGFACTLGGDDVGMLAVTLPTPEASNGAAAWRIGIDVGTTNTTVYQSAAGVSAGPLPLDGLGAYQITGASKPDRLDWTNRFFVPPKEEMPRLPFLTMYRTRREGSQPILDGNIFFVRAQDPPNLFDGSISSDLKWSEGASDREKTEALLGETLLLALAQAVRSGVTTVSLANAYPAAFWPKLRKTWIDAWTKSVYKLVKAADVTLDVAVEPLTESVAVARFFINTHTATMDEGAMVIDIGGGSTDLAYWRQNSLLWQASVHLAGKALLSEALYKVERSSHARQRELEEFWPNVAFSQVLRSGQKHLEGEQRAYERQIEAILARAGDEVLQRLGQHGEKQTLQFVIRHVALGLAGLLWYAGSALTWNNTCHSIAGSDINVYVAGNGSRLWHWLCHGRFDQLALAGFVETMARAGGGQHAVKMHLSHAPKSEVAAGLVGKSRITSTSAWDPNEEVFAGEAVSVNGVAEPVLRRNEIIGASALKVTALTNLEQMLDAFNAQAKKGGWFWPHFTEAELARLKREALSDVKQRLSEWPSTDRDELHLEPVFILGLRQILSRHLGLLA